MKNTEKSSFGGWKRELLDLKLQQRMCKWSRMSDRGNELYDFNGFGLLNGFWCITNYNKLHFNILLWLYHRKNIHCAFRSNIWVSEKKTLWLVSEETASETKYSLQISALLFHFHILIGWKKFLFIIQTIKLCRTEGDGEGLKIGENEFSQMLTNFPHWLCKLTPRLTNWLEVDRFALSQIQRNSFDDNFAYILLCIQLIVSNN